MDRGRILVSDRLKSVVFVNFKCGYSALNSSALNDLFDRKFASAVEYAQFRDQYRSYRKTLIVRDPVERFISFYFNWVVDKGPQFRDKEGRENHGYRVIKDIDPELYRALAEAPVDKRCTSSMLVRYAAVLENIIEKDSHLFPQSHLYKKAGLKIEDFNELVYLEALSTWGKEHLKVEIPTVNRSSRNQNSVPVDDEVSSVVERVYRDDIDDFIKAELAGVEVRGGKG